ncbi:hypothetical protein H4S01_005241 [Coemansia sp. RSA 2610]|nr:hypothetical protein H4S01_005241 [Coemansia sp. RSA 2610]
MMIASGGGQSDLELNPGALTIITSDNISASSPTTPVPASAPIARSATSQTFEQHLTSSDSSTMIGGSESAAFEQPLDGLGLAGRRTSPSTSPGVPGNRSLRARSKLAGAGIRRASTYVWGRSSVFIKALSSTDELPVSAQLQPPPPPQQQQHPGPGAWESDVDTGSTKIDEATSLQGPVVAPVLADTPPEAAPEPIPRPVSSARPSKRSPAAMRLHASRELVMTEKNFVDNLFVIKKVWMEPVFSSANSPKPIIPYQAARVIFFGVAALHAHASHFYREMDYALGSYERGQGPVEGREDDGMRIGALFRANDRHWSDFIAYVRNYGAAMNCLKQLQDYKPYLRYHEECMMQKRTNRQSLKDLLMLPIQRITRYTLLLKNILKHTPAVHSDHIDLCRAVKNVTHFATIVNECRRKQEEMQRVAEVFRGIESCPPFPHAESRSFGSEFFVRELISRLPTRLLLFSDMLLVAQASPQVTIDDSGSADPEADWTYYGFASLDDVEVQNADESTSTLITILSLNRNLTSSDNHVASRILNAGSRDSIPDHISALSHSTFPSPVPQPGQLERSQSRLHSMSPAPAGDYAPDRDTHQPPQRPKTASGHPGASFSAHHALALPNGSNSTLGSHGGPGCSGDLALSFRAQHPEHYGSTPSSTPTIAAGRTDVAPPRPAQLTLVMQHATSAMRKQFVRALKDATATLINDALGLCDSDAASGHPFGDSSSEVLNLHPL